jgi:hypothetical protein
MKAQTAGIIDPSRVVGWSAVGVPGGIPARTTICATFNPGATAAQINSGLQACPAGQTVFLNAGTYNLSSELIMTAHDNVTLRGAGADKTLLVFSGSAPCWGQSADLCARGADGNWQGGPTNSATWTGSGPWPKGTNQITLSSVANLKVGNDMILDQVDDLSDDGLIYICEQSTTFSPNQNPPCNDDSNATGGDSGAQRGDGTASVRGQQQIVIITAMNGNTVTFTPGLYMPNWRVFTDSRGTNVPGAWWPTTPAHGDGFEDFSVDHTNSTAYLGIGLYNCIGCWVKGVRGIKPNRDHVDLLFSPLATIRDNYFYGAQNLTGTGANYGIEAWVTSDTLMENNIFQMVGAPLIINSDCEGCVLGYNFTINDYFPQSSNWENQGIFLHSLISHVLMEGNIGVGVYSDLFHGTHNFITMFRNRFDGFEPNNGTTTSGHTNPLIIYPFNRYYNIVGNVLGTAGYHTIYQYTQSPEQGAGDKAIMVLGTGPVTCCQSGDPKVLQTLMLWGNYDTVNNGVRFLASEVPSGLTQFANPVPASQTLPASFYLSAKPSWWPAPIPWPPIGPDVIGGNIANVGGHANLTASAVCYYTAMGGPANGVGSVLSFNAAACYNASSSTQLLPPTNLTATVH